MAPTDSGECLNTSLVTHQTAGVTSAAVDRGLGPRLGLREGAYCAPGVGIPFDYESQALLYCPMHLPEPRNAGWLDAVTDELEVLVKAAGGRTLALFTSWRAMETVAEELDPRVDYEVLTQRDLPKPALIERFMDDESSVLCATMGFWQGVDIPGRALSLVTIDRLPFPRPDEPLLQARRDRAGPQAFSTIDLPRAATMLAQGTGRLIWTAEDVGVVAVLDPRLGPANSRWTVVNARPPRRATRHQD